MLYIIVPATNVISFLRNFKHPLNFIKSCRQFKKLYQTLGTTVIPRRIWKQWLCKTSGGKRGVLWEMSKWWIGLNRRTRLHFVFPAQPWSLRCVHVRSSKRVWFLIPRCEFRIPSTGFWIPCQFNLDYRFQSLAEFRIPWAIFRIPKPRIPDSTKKFLIPDSTNKYVLDSGIRFASLEANIGIILRFWETAHLPLP